jgi:hypothetical protein
VECEREELPKDCVLILVSGKVQALAGLHAVRLPIWSSGDLHIKSASYRRTGGWPDLCKIDSRAERNRARPLSRVKWICRAQTTPSVRADLTTNKMASLAVRTSQPRRALEYSRWLALIRQRMSSSLMTVRYLLISISRIVNMEPRSTQTH